MSSESPSAPRGRLPASGRARCGGRVRRRAGVWDEQAAAAATAAVVGAHRRRAAHLPAAASGACAAARAASSSGSSCFLLLGAMLVLAPVQALAAAGEGASDLCRPTNAPTAFKPPALGTAPWSQLTPAAGSQLLASPTHASPCCRGATAASHALDLTSKPHWNTPRLRASRGWSPAQWVAPLLPQPCWPASPSGELGKRLKAGIGARRAAVAAGRGSALRRRLLAAGATTRHATLHPPPQAGRCQGGRG